MQTEGQYLVGSEFNPSASKAVSDIKQIAADLIDCIIESSNDDRTRDLAVKAVEEGAMWGVKAATKRPRQ